MVVVVILGIIHAHRMEKERRAAMAALAAEYGLDFDPGRDTGQDDRFTQFSIFRKGHSRTAFNTISGGFKIAGEQVPLFAGDYRYSVTSGSGKNRRTRTYRLSYLIAGLPHSGVPKLLVRPENLFDKFVGAIGFDDIDFESAEFSRRFHVSSSDKRFAYDLIDSRMMEFLMNEQSTVLDIEGGFICVLLGTRRWEVAEIGDRMVWLGMFFDHWPNHVVKSLADGGYGS